MSEEAQALADVLADMVMMMDDLEEHGEGSVWHKAAKAALLAWNTRPDSKRPDLTNYPNLASVLQGCVSGTFGEWPGVRAELSQLIESFGVPDSKPYRHKDFQAYYGNSKDLSFVDKFERKAAQAGFDAARDSRRGEDAAYGP